MRRLSRVLIMSASATVLTACAVGPDYVKPESIPTQAAFVSAANPAFTQAAPAGDWWRLFQAPALDALVAQALEANKDIAVASANLAQVRASLSEARAGRLPTTTASASVRSVRQQVQPGTPPFEADVYNAGFDMNYEVDIFGRVSRNIEAVRADRDAAQAALDATRLTVAAETARAFADACAANVQIEVANRTLGLQQETLGLTRSQFDNGRGTGLDVSRAATQVENTRATLPPLLAAKDAALFRLAVLTGQPPAQIPVSARDCTTIPQVASAIPVGDGAGLLVRRPDVRQAERRLAAATARIGVATAALYPQVTLGGNIGSTALKAGDLLDDYTFSVGPLISWSFPNILATRARIKQAGAAADAALATFEQANLVALQETETALSAYARELDRRSALRRGRDQSREALRLARMRYDAGVDSFLTVLDAQRTLASLEAQLAQSEAAVTTNQIVLFKALGGGWETPAAE
ncbi:efflux transporter outer membrane subunit [Caulobacter segnis]|uniref:efflux transporter outer membrane subunit n=1 Tax=Caulobacter segnis TaxID=88688 RepID=UPI00240F5752|nr:efflux transporter outer membrane subunit [Caulobacter segnis]MDG2522870.1 efflux transporter outer membrane subunit [Caulobacter segnis]